MCRLAIVGSFGHLSVNSHTCPIAGVPYSVECIVFGSSPSSPEVASNLGTREVTHFASLQVAFRPVVKVPTVTRSVRAYGIIDDAKKTASDVADNVKDAVQSGADKVSNAAGDARDQAQKVAGDVTDKAEEVAGDAEGAAKSAKRDAESQVKGAADKASAEANKAADKVKGAVDK
jgi:hypothetical protein